MLKYERDGYVWNMVASFINAGKSVIILMIVSRTVGMFDAGIMITAFSISNLMMFVGKYGMRNFQATDLIRRFSNRTYYASRIISFVLMVVFFFLYMLWGKEQKGYSDYKILVITGVFVLFSAEVVEDVFWGTFQRIDRIDIAARNYSIRWIASIIVWCVGLLAGRENVKSVWLAAFVSWLVLFFQFVLYKKYLVAEAENKLKETRELLFKCFPLMISSLMLFFISNSSKLALDGMISEKNQACYGFVAMPIFVIGLANMILCQPILVKMAREWNEDVGKLSNRMLRHLGRMFTFFVICEIGASTIGIKILGWLFASDLTGYGFELNMLLFAGFWLAITDFFSATLVIMRKHTIQMVSLAISSLIALVFLKSFIHRWGTSGAATLNMICAMIPAIIYGVEVFLQIKRKTRFINC